jgi:hypothetical protein
VRRNLIVATLLFAPWLAQAETYKCKQPNGSTSFQDHPCDAKTVPLVQPAPSGAPSSSSSASPSWKDKALESERQRLAREAKASDEQAQANDKLARCTAARQRLGMLKDAGSVFQRDKAGERHYLDDKERRNETVAAQSRVTADCS